MAALLLFLSFLGVAWCRKPDFTVWPSSERDITNSTAGFQKIYVLNSSGHFPRVDSMTIAGSVTDLEFTFVDTEYMSRTKAQSPRALNNVQETEPRMLRQWRAHARALTTMLSADDSTALILEDDADWSVHLKDQIREVAKIFKTRRASYGPRRPSRNQPATSTDIEKRSDWDIIFLGSCADHIKRNPTTMPYATHSAVLSVTQAPAAVSTQQPSIYEPILFLSKPTLACPLAYAITASGARKLIDRFIESGGNDHAPSDIMARFCASSENRCLAVSPALFEVFKGCDKDSIQAGNPLRYDGKRDRVCQQPSSSEIMEVESVRLNGRRWVEEADLRKQDNGEEDEEQDVSDVLAEIFQEL